MAGAKTILMIYGLIFGATFFVMAFMIAWSEIKTKVGAMMKARKGFGIVQIIKGNGRTVDLLINFSGSEVKYGNSKYSLEDAKNNPSKFIRIKWAFVPVVMFREGNPAPISMDPETETSIDMDYFNKTVELAYLAGATDKISQQMDQIRRYALLAFICSALTAVFIVWIFPNIAPIMQALGQAKPYMSNFASKLISWLR